VAPQIVLSSTELVSRLVMNTESYWKGHKDAVKNVGRTRHNSTSFKQRSEKRKQRTEGDCNKPTIIPFINVLSPPKAVDPKRFLVSELENMQQ
jgi:hypothetical protein